jgi:hypothetical protein
VVTTSHTQTAAKLHHSLFCLQTPLHMQGIEHLAFHVQGPMAMLTAGTRFKNKGYETFWGPGGGPPH